MKKKAKEGAVAAQACQLRSGYCHPFGALKGFVPLGSGEDRVYRQLREAIPVLDGAVLKLIRLCGGFQPVCRNPKAQQKLGEFLKSVPCGRGQQGLESFLSGYLDSLLTVGRAVGEMVVSGGHLKAVCWGDVTQLQAVEGDNPLDFSLCTRGADGQIRALPRQELLLFTPFQPEADSPYGVSMLRSMPFLSEVLLKIWQTIGVNWERVGKLRFAVVCKGENDGMAEERCARVAKEWSAAMQSGREGAVRDFVASGDVEIRVIGADNQILDSEVPVRQILEQLVARTGIPPFLLGLSWSSTERMSSQQADIMTSEIDAIRRSLTPVVERICRLWLRLHGFDSRVEVVWDTVNLQDEETLARAALYRAQAKAQEGERSETNGRL